MKTVKRLFRRGDERPSRVLSKLAWSLASKAVRRDAQIGANACLREAAIAVASIATDLDISTVGDLVGAILRGDAPAPACLSDKQYAIVKFVDGHLPAIESVAYVIFSRGLIGEDEVRTIVARFKLDEPSLS